jgi:hypothetical protein
MPQTAVAVAVSDSAQIELIVDGDDVTVRVRRSRPLPKWLPGDEVIDTTGEAVDEAVDETLAKVIPLRRVA